MQTPPCPPLDKALLDHLKAAFRTEIEVPRTECSLWEVGSRAGKQYVLDYLGRKLQEQERTPNTNVYQQA